MDAGSVAAWPSCAANWPLRQSELATDRERLCGAAERAALLEELEQRQEGMSAGVKEVLARAQAERPGRIAA